MSSVVLRPVPGTSPVHRLWAGTKLIAIAVVSLVLLVNPSWPVLGATTALLAVVSLAGKIPLSAWPRPPWWFWAALAVGAAINAVASPGAVLRYAQTVAFALLLLATSMVVILTTSLSAVAPAITQLGAPLRWIRVPVDEIAIAIGLCLRGLPLLVEELRVLAATRKLGGSNTATFVDLVSAVMSVTMRRAREVGEAITVRGGTAQMTRLRPEQVPRPGRSDAVAALLLIVYTAGCLTLLFL